MFGIGIWETLIIIAAAVIFIKPADIPAVVRKIGRVFGQLRYSYDIFLNSIREIERESEKALSIPEKEKKNRKRKIVRK